MPALVIPNSLQVTVIGEILGQPWANVYGVTCEDPFLLEQSVADEIGACFRDFYEAFGTTFHTSWSADECIVADLRTASSPAYDAAFLDVTGSNSGNPMPSNLAICATHRTGLRGKSFRGRTYLCGWCEDSNSAAGELESTFQTSVVTLFDALRADLAAVSTAVFQLAVLSRTLLVATPITETDCDGAWDHQDRRKTAG